jgi:hypothetical protein
VHRPLIPPRARQLLSQPVALHARASSRAAGADATACAPPNPSAAAVPTPNAQPRIVRVVIRISSPSREVFAMQRLGGALPLQAPFHLPPISSFAGAVMLAR